MSTRRKSEPSLILREKGDMAILNYTTTIDAEKTAAEIQKKLAKAKYDDYFKKTVDFWEGILASGAQFQIPHKKTHDVMCMGAPFGQRPDVLGLLVESGVKLSIFGSEKWKNYDNL